NGCTSAPHEATSIVLRWINENRDSISSIGPRAWPLLKTTLIETFDNAYISEAAFGEGLLRLFQKIEEDGYKNIVVVPMRPLDTLISLLSGHRNLLDSHAKWHEQFWSI